jgi:glycosyltransferase involved in cell wall biosynthesis
MKVLWVNSNFMHPTTKGGQIRTLEMLRYLHQWHEIHYVAIENADQPEGPARAHEYSYRAYPFRYRVPDKASFAFVRQLIAGLVSRVPVAVSRFDPPGLRAFLADLIARERFDAAVVDHLAPTAYFPDLAHSVLFQHNVESMIWRRHVEHATGLLKRAYFKLQARRMFEYERRVCRESGQVVACSAVDAQLMGTSFGISRVSHVPTGVNIEYFAQPKSPAPAAPRVDFAFIGSMDWLPNQQGVLWFARDILPIVRRSHPHASFAIVGRTPPASISALAADPLITVTGTVDDVRPWFWQSAVSVVPLLVGGGTRLKIYEAMAARVPVVSTTIGAEGLAYSNGEDVLIGDTAEAFAAHCVTLIGDAEKRRRMADLAWQFVSSNYSWETAARHFDDILRAAPRLPAAAIRTS